MTYRTRRWYHLHLIYRILSFCPTLGYWALAWVTSGAGLGLRMRRRVLGWFCRQLWLLTLRRGIGRPEMSPAIQKQVPELLGGPGIVWVLGSLEAASVLPHRWQRIWISARRCMQANSNTFIVCGMSTTWPAAPLALAIWAATFTSLRVSKMIPGIGALPPDESRTDGPSQGSIADRQTWEKPFCCD